MLRLTIILVRICNNERTKASKWTPATLHWKVKIGHDVIIQQYQRIFSLTLIVGFSPNEILYLIFFFHINFLKYLETDTAN